MTIKGNNNINRSENNNELAKKAFFHGLKNMQSGLYEDAARLFRRSLELEPDRLNTIINLSSALLEMGNLKGAQEIISQGLKLYPNDEVLYLNQGLIYEKYSNLQMALVNYQKAVLIKSDYTEASNNIRIVLAKVNEAQIKMDQASIAVKDKQCDKALSLISDAISIDVGNAYAYNFQANILTDLKLLKQALVSFEKAIECKVDYIEAYINRGVVLEELAMLQEAEASYKLAIKFGANSSDAYFNVANVLRKLKHFDESLLNYNKAIQLDPKNSEIYFNKGNLLREMKQLEKSLLCYENAIKFLPDYAEAYYNIGNIYEELSLYEQALFMYEKAIQLKPKYAEAYLNKGVVLEELMRLEEALLNYDKAIENKNTEAYYNKALLLLLTGNISEGFKLYEWRWSNEERLNKNSDFRTFQKPLWLGKEKLTNKTILVYSEQGLGDTIQFCRYIKNVKMKGARVIFEVQKSLVNILSNLEGVDQIVTSEDKLPEFDYQCPLLSLPLACQTAINTIPHNTPYLQIKNKLNKWQKYIGQHGFKIAICWQGSPNGKIDKGRSFPLKLFENISKINGVRLISIQKNFGIEQLNELPAGMVIEQFPFEFDYGEEAFQDSAAIMQCVDLIITSDTSLTHLAGALGLRTWLLLKYVPDWRWMLDRNDCPWYPNHKLFRQKSNGNWSCVFKEVETEIKSIIEKINLS